MAVQSEYGRQPAAAEGFDLETVLTLMQNDISSIKGNMATKADVKALKGDMATKADVNGLKTSVNTLIDSVADTTKRVVDLERTQHEH